MPIGIFKVTGESMLPGLRCGDYVLVFCYPKKLTVGDVVVVQHPQLGIIIKRVKHFLPNGHFFIVGDNTLASTPSEIMGEISRDQILGKVFFRIKLPN